MDPIIETSNGRVRGMDRGEALAFLGIRYGAPTGGANRFRPPQPVTKWSGVFDALAPAASAPQLPRPENTDPFHAWYSSIRPIGEDCLALNVFTPGQEGRRPVMFWIHGGGWREFSGTAPGFDGVTLSSSQDVVVVTVNHRLNAFGFLHFDTNDERFADSGNAGLLDLVAALAWVRDNIGAFGGDPNNVTLFGESGGGSKIAALLAMRSARGLFHKAIVQSSAGARQLATPDDATRTARELAGALGRSGLDPADLQALPMETLLEATAMVPGPYRGMIDNRNFDSHPFDTGAPESASGVPLLIGCTNTEMTYFLRHDPRNFSLDLTDTHRRLRRFFGADEGAIDRLVETYRDYFPADTATDLLVRIATDHIFKRNNYAIGGMQSAHAPVHAYLFAWETPIEGGHIRSPHTIEVPFIFGNVAAAADCVGTATGLLNLAQTCMSAWASFARSGEPRGPALPDWQRYEADGQKVMFIDHTSRLLRDPGVEARAALDAFPYFYYQQPMIVLGRD